MNANLDILAAIQQDRERSIARDRLARLAAQARECCRPSTIGRLVRTLRRTAVSC